MASLHSSHCFIRHRLIALAGECLRHSLPARRAALAAPLAVLQPVARPPVRALSSRAPTLAQSTRKPKPLPGGLPEDLLELFARVPRSAIGVKTPGSLAGASEMTLPEPETAVPLEGELFVPSESDASKSYRIHHFGPNAYSCNCMAWSISKGREIDARSCKHLRQVLGDEHEDARVGPGVGVAKGKSKSKAKSKVSSASTSGSTSASASTSRSGTPAAKVVRQPQQASVAAPSSKKRANPEGPQAAGLVSGFEDTSDSLDVQAGADTAVATAQAGPASKKKKERHGGIELLLAKKLDLADKPKKDPTGWWISEKLDGVRAYWDGESTLWSRVGNPFSAPLDFIEKLPVGHELDGELFLGRDRFDETSGIVRSMNSPRWSEIRYMVFDVPSRGHETFETRQRFLEELFPRASPDTPTSASAAQANPLSADAKEKAGDGFIRVVEQEKCDGWDHLEEKLELIKRLGGEGLMLRQPGSKYENKRSGTLLKVKTFYDAEARVVGHEPGKGRLEGLLGSLVCVMEDEQTEFKVGSGFDDARRAQPPPIGAIVTYRFQDLTKAGIPRFPTFVGERFDVTGPKDAVLHEKNAEDEA